METRRRLKYARLVALIASAVEDNEASEARLLTIVWRTNSHVRGPTKVRFSFEELNRASCGLFEGE